MKYLSLALLSLIILRCSSPNKTAEQAAPMEESNTAAEESVQDSSYVFFKHPADGATVPSPVYIEMGVSGMQIEPAGVVKEGYGHHHILINQVSWPEGTVIPMSDSTIHFGKGQTDTTLELGPGEYVLSLQFADGVHSSYGASMAASIKVVVE